jgi:hypothetical protein
VKPLKILTIEATGYKLLAPRFRLSFLSKKRVNPQADNSDLFEFAPGYYLPNEYAFIGKNSSGKTTVLELVNLCYDLLNTGRVVCDPLTPNESHLELQIVFAYQEKIFRYATSLVSPQINRAGPTQYYLIDEENLEEAEITTRSGKDLSNLFFHSVKSFTPRGGMTQDTSSLPYYTTDAAIGPWSGTASGLSFVQFLTALYSPLFTPGQEKDWTLMMIDKIFHLLDDGIDYIHAGAVLGSYRYKRRNQDEKIVDAETLSRLLSSGTKRGFLLYALAMGALLTGTTIIIDEIETDFNKNLVYNLFFLLNDPSINTKGATLIFSTHYIEILDILPRNDNIDVLHRDGNVITLKNIAEDYRTRPAILKSNQFDSNAFDTLLNYDLLMDFTKELRKRCAAKKD